jgi:hypothetical protein
MRRVFVGMPAVHEEHHERAGEQERQQDDC